MAKPKTDEALEAMVDSDWERIILANAMCGPECASKVLAVATPEDFAIPSNRFLFTTMQELAERRGMGAVNLSDIAGYLVERGDTAKVNGLGKLAEIYSEGTFFAFQNLDEPLRVLRSKTVDREAWRLSMLMQEQCRSGYTRATDDVDAAMERLKQLQRSLETGDTAETIGDALTCSLDRHFAMGEKPLGTPWAAMDDRLNSGLRRGELWLLAARPGVGKSTVALQIALHNAAQGKRVGFFSLEMSKGQILNRLWSSVGHIPHDYLVAGNLDAELRRKVNRIHQMIKGYPLAIHDDVRSLRDIGTRVAKAKYDLVVIDYVQLIETNGRFENRTQEVSFISRRLKIMTMPSAAPVLALSQLSRSNESENRAPQLSDLRDSGSLEQDADAVLMGYQPSRSKKPSAQAPKNLVEWFLRKRRNGASDLKCDLYLDGPFCRFKERSEEKEYAA